MTLIFFHLFCTISSIILGYYLFVFKRKAMEIQKYPVYLLSGLLIMAGISGIFLNTYSFSPFHVLAIVTITTIPLALWNLHKSQILEFKKGLLYNFVGLNLAMVGAFEPERYIGRKLGLSMLSWQILGVISIIIAIFVIIQANRKNSFLKS